MTNLADYYGTRPIDIVAGEGCYLFDQNGKRYIDFVGGWCVGNIGWKRKEVIEAIKKEAERGTYVPPVFKFSGWEEFAQLLVKIAPNKKLTRVFKCTSGSEAVEFAIKCARAATGKKTIISIDGVYHGHTYGAASVGDACTLAMAPCVPNFVKMPMPLRRRSRESAALISAEAVIKQFQTLVEENNDIAAFLSEPVWSNAGVIIPPPDFYPTIEKICREHGILLVMDEVATGFGRCGKLFASELWGIKPDILCLGKGLTGGYSTMGATLVTEEINNRARNIPQYSTFGWAPFDLAAAKANVELLLKEKLWENAATIGDYILTQLQSLNDLPYVGEVRGIGMLLGIEIVKDKKSLEPDWSRAQKIQDACAEHGLLIETAGHILFMSPPLILTKKIADEGLAILKKIMKT